MTVAFQLARASTIALAIATTAPSFAQATPSQAAVPAAAEDNSVAGVEEIVVTAERRAENLQRTPIAITALTANSLQSSGITDLRGVVQAAPSLYFAPYPSSTTTLVLFMRGQGIGDPNIITKDGGVGLYVDGIYQSRPQASAFDLADVERVEVLRGPQGTLYGRNTTGGAVNIISKKPTGELGAHGLLSLGNYDYRRALVNLDLPQFGTFKVKLTGLYSNRDGWANNAANTAGTPDAHDFQSDRKYAVRGAVRWEPTDGITVDYSGDYSDQRTTPVRYVTENAFAPFLFPGYTADPETAYRPVYLPYSHVKSDGHTLIGEWRASDALTLRSLSSYRHIKVRTYQDYTEAFLAPFFAFDQVGSKTYTQEFQAVGTVADQFKYVVGIYYFREKANHFETVDVGTGTPGQQVLVDRDTNAKSTSKAIFGQLTWTPEFADGKFDVTVGGRYTRDKRTADRIRTSNFFIGQTSPLVARRFNGPGATIPLGSVVGATDVKNSKFNPALTLSYRPVENVSLYAKVVTGYKAGGSNEASPTFTRTFGPETVTSYEAGIKSDLLDRRLRVNLAGFIAKYKDLQLDISADPADASLADTFNVGRATVKGLEADLTAVPIPGLTLSASYAYTTSKIRNVLAPAGSIFDPAVNPGSPVQVGDNITGYFVLPFTPKNSVRLSGDWVIGTFGSGDLAAHVDYTWKDKVYTTAGDGPSVPLGRDAPINKAYGLVDARLSYTIDRGGGRNISIGLWGKNVFDKRYPGFVIGSGSIIAGYPNQAISYGDPATYGIDVGFSF
ncbi:TonB-dependent receptor [Rhizorhabdus wittichii]|jgi:iron complex outermembrane receptor protein|uniref:TonB-dependent receptor n=1 Tax=Rhizorhabdus wittichii TaxID=160791 RepID=A0A975D176_9SPHN|nr:TonB-dependent receptor [Rhizorhabdus wittichii]QTH19855.1 TonB-dependent receptor [Rhizorhabdus wittichii]